MRSLLDLELFCAAVTSRSLEWTSRGIRSELKRSPDDGRDKAAAWVIVEAEGGFGQLTVWDSGEAELEVMSASGRLIQTHYDGLVDAGQPLDELVTTLLLDD